MNTTRVLALLPLFVVLAHSFSWDIVVAAGKRLKFYNNGTLMHTEDNPTSKEIYSVAYDPVHSRVLFADHHDTNMSISSFDLTTRKIKILVTKITNAAYKHLAYDPLTQLLFWTEDKEIYSISLKPASSNKTVDGNLLVTADKYCMAIAVDSCGGYIYWVTEQHIDRAAFDGSEREVLIKKDSDVVALRSLAIDQQTQKMYWTEISVINNTFPLYINYAELNGKNIRTLYFKKSEDGASSLAISKDFIYWKSSDERAILRLPKNQQLDVEPIVYSISSSYLWDYHLTAAKYTIMEQTLGTKTCEALKSLIPSYPGSNTSDVGLPPDHFANVSEECYSSTCRHYCHQGNCSVGADGYPKCSCEAGYYGERCEVNACYKHCLHGGVCSLNEEEEPVCECTADFEGERCDIAITHTDVCNNRTEQLLLDLRSEVKQYREELQYTLQLYLDSNSTAAVIQIREESKKNDLQNHDETTSKSQTSNTKI